MTLLTSAVAGRGDGAEVLVQPMNFVLTREPRAGGERTQHHC